MGHDTRHSCRFYALTSEKRSTRVFDDHVDNSRVDCHAADPERRAGFLHQRAPSQDPVRGFAETAYNAGLALFVTAWGATAADGGACNPAVCATEAQAWHDWMAERNIGWAAWKLDGCADSSCLFKSDDAPQHGGRTDQWLNGHARFRGGPPPGLARDRAALISCGAFGADVLRLNSRERGAPLERRREPIVTPETQH